MIIDYTTLSADFQLTLSPAFHFRFFHLYAFLRFAFASFHAFVFAIFADTASLADAFAAFIDYFRCHYYSLALAFIISRCATFSHIDIAHVRIFSLKA
jgi:hypothetical protein